MNTLHLTFYLVFLVIILEIIKIAKRELKKSIIFFITQLAVLVFSFLIIVKFATNKIFALVPVLILTVVVIDWFEMKKNTRTITLKLIVPFCLVLIGIIFIIYGMVGT